MARVRTVLLWVVASVVAVVLLVVSVGAWWVGSLYQSEEADPGHASAAFTDIRQQFVAVPPVFEIRENRLIVVRTTGEAPSSAASAVHLLVWMPAERTLSRVRLPFGLSVVATEPLPLEALAGVGNRGLGALLEARRRGNELNVRIADLERYGRTLLLDGVTGDGKHVLMWNE